MTIKDLMSVERNIEELKQKLSERTETLSKNKVKMGVSLESIKYDNFNKGLRYAIEYLEGLEARDIPF
jgi:hypothetical protein